MSKTETQSEAMKLSALLNVAMAFDHGRIGTDRRFVEMDATVVASVDAELRRLGAENKALRERLEIDPSHPIDGIEARDETIRQLEAQVKRLRDVLEAVEMDVVYVGGGENSISDTVIDEVDVVLQQVRFQQAGSPQAAAKTGDAA